MTIIYDKPFKTYAEQIEVIKRKNIIVANKDFAKSILSTISYHTLMNGYKNSLLNEKDSERFIDGIDFETLYTIHLLDTNLNSLLFKNILYVERSFKTKLSYTIAEKFGVTSDFTSSEMSRSQNDYLSIHHYSNSTHKRYNTLVHLKESVLNCKNHQKILYHYKKNKNHIPPWILVTNLTLGEVQTWYSILKGPEKTAICEQIIPYCSCDIEEKKEFLTSSLELLRCYRNNSAHGNRTFNKDLDPGIPKNATLKILPSNVLSEREYLKGIGRRDLFSIILIINILIQDPYILANFIADLVSILQPYEGLRIANKTIYDLFDLPADIFRKLENLNDHKIRVVNIT